MEYGDARARWDERYSGEDYLFGTEPNAFLAAQRHRFAPGQRVLALADGEGRNGVFLARQGLEVLSVDISRVALAKAERLAACDRVALRTECADLARWDWGEARFDAVVAIFIQFAGPTLRDLIFARTKTALKPGGLVLLEGYRPEQLGYRTGGPPDVENLYTEDMLRTAFADFTLLHLESHDSVIHEGSGHNGLSALIDLVARKPQAAAAVAGPGG
jgi:cyclopropane fatty-acyl-phospholipid synthase-like methyltransferase